MKIRFNGMYSKVGKSGCNCHGTHNGGKIAFLTHRSFVLPSNRQMSFHIDEVYEVSEEDARFLLSYTYTDKDGLTFNAFSEVK